MNAGTPPFEAASGEQAPSVIAPQGAAGARLPSEIACVGADRVIHSTGEAALLNRVGRVLADLSAAREVSDAEIRQHAADCTHLMELAYARFEQFHLPADRDDAVLWMHRRDEAHRSMSPAWKAAREAQIQQDIARGCGYFIEQGDAARARIAGGRG